MTKYEIDKSTKISLNNLPHYRIKALKDFVDIKKGDLGGYVHSEHNLSQDGNCWVYDNAIVTGNARVVDNAIVQNNATVNNNAVVKNNANVKDNASINLDATIAGDATVSGNAIVTNNAALKKVVKHRQIISKRQMILFSHVRHQLHSHICKKQVMTEVIS